MSEQPNSPETPEPLRILHADDNPTDRFLLERHFKKGLLNGDPNGYRLVSVDGGSHRTVHTLAEYILAEKPHLVIADGDMGPEVTGPRLAQALLSGKVHRRILFVLLSGGGGAVPSKEVLGLMEQGGIHVLIHKDEFLSGGKDILKHLVRLCRFMDQLDPEPPHESLEAASAMTGRAAQQFWQISGLSPMPVSPDRLRDLTSPQERSWLIPHGHLEKSDE